MSRNAPRTRASPYALLVLLAPVALAQSECAKNFRESGDPRNGATYLSYVTIPNLDAHSALGQVEAIGLAAGLKVGAENYEGDSGTLVLYPRTKDASCIKTRVFPIQREVDGLTPELYVVLKEDQDTVDGQIHLSILSRAKYDAWLKDHSEVGAYN